MTNETEKNDNEVDTFMGLNVVSRYILLGVCFTFLAMTVILGGVTGIYQFFIDNFF